MNAPVRHVYVSFIKTTPERLWKAITDGTDTQKYFFGCRFEAANLQPGTPFSFVDTDDDETMISGSIVSADPPRKLVHTFRGSNPKEAGDPESTVTWEIAPFGDTCRLRLTHEHATQNATATGTNGGWPIVLSSLKSYLETGTGLDVPSGTSVAP